MRRTMTTNPQFSARRQAESEALQELPGGQIDIADIPEPLNWTDAGRGIFYDVTRLQPPLRQHARECEEKDDQGTGRYTDRA